MIKKILLGLLAVLLILQIFQIDKTNPASEPGQDFLSTMDVPDNIQTVLKDACFDCHSHETKYPWYTYVQPVGWWVKDHIDHGRKELNFSTWASYEPKRARHKLEECFEEIEDSGMPLKSYTLIHGEARLTKDQRDLLVDWFRSEYEAYEME